MQKVDEEIRRIIDEQYSLARRLIEENSDKLHVMARALLEWETIDAEQIEDIMSGREPRPPKPAPPGTGAPPAAPSAGAPVTTGASTSPAQSARPAREA
jgi:cell division protease FtsH